MRVQKKISELVIYAVRTTNIRLMRRFTLVFDRVKENKPLYITNQLQVIPFLLELLKVPGPEFQCLLPGCEK